MKRLICIALGSLLLQATASAEAHKDKPKKQAAREAGRVDDRSDTRVAVRIVFTSADVRIIRSHYEPRYRNLPPGLRKKVARGGQLPPGWQKKFEPFPVDLDRRLPPLAPGYRRGVLDGHAVIYDTRSHVLIDVAELF
jgi:hypothetical protein